MEIHISTQTGIVNYVTANELYNMGAKRIVTARELSLEEIADYLKEVEAINDEQEMKKKLKQQIEINKMKIEYERIKEIVN